MIAGGVRGNFTVNSVSDDDGSHPLALASIAGQQAAVRYLLKQGAEVNASNHDGDTALHLAAFFGHLEVANALLEAGADPKAKTNKGKTPLQNAQAPWSGEISGMIEFVGKLLGIKFDLEEIRKTRPMIADVLRDRPPGP